MDILKTFKRYHNKRIVENLSNFIEGYGLKKVENRWCTLRSKNI